MKVSKAFKYVILLLLAAATLYPLFWMFINSLKTNLGYMRDPWYIPLEPQWQNFSVAFLKGGIARYARNSVIVTAFSLIGVIVVSTLAAFAMTKIKPRGSELVYFLVLIGMMVPAQVVVIPIFQMLLKVRLLDTHLALIIPYVGIFSPYATFLLRSFYAAIPQDIMHAARIDGCSNFRIYWNISLPMVKPGIGVIAILSGINMWNEFLFALLFVRDARFRTISAGLVTFVLEHKTYFSLLFAGVSISIIPLIIITVLFQRTMVKGLTAGALKY